MITVLILFVLAAVGLGLLILLAAVIAAIQIERRDERLSTQASSPLSAMVRRLLGVYVRRPADPDDSRPACLVGHAVGGDAEDEVR